MNIIKKIMPREERFFDLFDRHAATLQRGTGALERLLSGQDIDGSRAELRDIEHQGDDIAREVLVAVRRAFVTPFDRSAITALISAMDDALDEMWQTAMAAGIYRVTDFPVEARESAKVAVRASALIVEALPLLRDVGRNSGRLHGLTEAVVHLEAEADALYERGLQKSFDDHAAERPMQFFVAREILSHIERVLDRLEDIADEIQGIVIDHA